ncbi:serine protease inhibitor 42Dd-like [Scaptodrosophila lebanonensis]|uniref:Serine protease inhibitor 42Dd-like n=1 Tax=Drosophila lebanonensis TaxID=7225 RepID=A0A6J2TG05_DROLE|nr:serine protease inhibitor 42Dd-like [Scaptodrosophila lebanonensis]
MANHRTFLQVRLIVLLSFLAGIHAEEFAGRFLQKALQFSRQDNVIVSPFSVREALAQVYVGVKGNAADELHRELHLTGHSKREAVEEFRRFHEISSPGGGATLKIANRIFVAHRFPLLPKYKDLVRKSFRTRTENINFEKKELAASRINKWISRRTENFIKDIVQAESLDDDLKLMVINAIYFHGKWKTPFNPENTRKNNFFIPGEGAVKVDMMHSHLNLLHGRIDALDANAVELPYINSNISMMVILPNRLNGLPEVEKLLHEVNLITLTYGFRKWNIDLALPKFKFEFELNLNQPLKDMGIREIFRDPDFSDLTNSEENLLVSKVIQKAVIEVNEEGSKAAAVTVVEIAALSAWRPSFIVNRPFIFVIKDQQRVYFVGRVSRLN